MKLTRRKFIIGAIAAIPVAVWVGFGTRTSYRDTIAGAVRRSLSDLTLDEAGLFHFADDFIKHFGKSARRVALLGAAMRLERVPLVGVLVDLRLHVFHDFTSELFLMSSDFFQAGRDVNAPVRYVQFYDPYERPCTNPLARFE